MRTHLGWKNLFILGLIAEKERYGYELKKLLLEYYETTGITTTSIYRSLKYAERHGWISGTYRESKNFVKYQYSLTPKGKKKLQEEIEYYLSQALMMYYKEFNTALRFRLILEEDKIVAALKERRTKLMEKLNNLSKYINDPGPGSSASFQHVKNYLDSEIKWINNYLVGKNSNITVFR